jgi:riboflavin-specific deaminase-like protein
VRFARLHPEPGPVDIADQLADLHLGDRARPGRPYVVLNFVASVDGRAAVRGSSGPLGDEGDREVFFGLRAAVDAVLTGTGTLRVERYGRLVRRPERRAARVRAGLAEDPLAVVVARSGHVPTEPAIWDDPDSSIVVFAPPGTEAPERGADVRREPLEPVALPAVLERLRTGYGVRSLLCEGGPTLASAMLGDGLVDELFLTVAPMLAGGGHEPGIAEGLPLPEPARLELVWVLERAGSLFLRYRLSS